MIKTSMHFHPCRTCRCLWFSAVCDFVEVMSARKRTHRQWERISHGHTDVYIAVQLHRSIILMRNCGMRGVDNPPWKSAGRNNWFFTISINICDLRYRGSVSRCRDRKSEFSYRGKLNFKMWFLILTASWQCNGLKKMWLPSSIASNWSCKRTCPNNGCKKATGLQCHWNRTERSYSSLGLALVRIQCWKFQGFQWSLQ
jgi:hypothetical protein